MRDEVAALLASPNASENCQGIGMIMTGVAEADDFTDTLLALESSTKRAPLYMSVGDLASIVLDHFELKAYAGNSERVRNYITQLQNN